MDPSESEEGASLPRKPSLASAPNGIVGGRASGTLNLASLMGPEERSRPSHEAASVPVSMLSSASRSLTESDELRMFQ